MFTDQRFKRTLGSNFECIISKEITKKQCKSGCIYSIFYKTYNLLLVLNVVLQWMKWLDQCTKKYWGIELSLLKLRNRIEPTRTESNLHFKFILKMKSFEYHVIKTQNKLYYTNLQYLAMAQWAEYLQISQIKPTIRKTVRRKLKACVSNW